MQQPGANPGGAPAWAAVTNPNFSQAVVDFAINRGYERLMMDLADLELYTNQITFTSTANVYKYPIPVNNSQPKIHLVQRVFYAPLGMNYTLEFVPGVRLIDWNEFQVYTGAGYLTQFAFGVQPDFAAVGPTRQYLHFYPGSANSGDTITVNYMPVPTAGTNVAPLAAETDTPVLPADTHEAIVMYALVLLWRKAREFEASMASRQEYGEEVKRIRDLYLRSSTGSSMRIISKHELLPLMYPFGPVLG